MLRVGLDGDVYLQESDLAGAYAPAWRNADYIETMDMCLPGHDDFLPKLFTHIIYVTRMFNS